MANASDHRSGEFLGADLFLGDPFLEDVVSVNTIFNGFEPCIVSQFRDVSLSNVDQHLNSTQEQARWVGQVLSGSSRCRTVDRFEHGTSVTNVSATCQPDRSSNLSCNVGQDITIQVGHHNDVKYLGGVSQLGSTDIDNPVLVLNVRVLGTDLIENLMKQTIGQLHDIVLGEASYLLPSVSPCILKGITNDLFGARARDQLQALHHIDGLAVFDTCVQIFFIFANDNHIHFGMLGANVGIVTQARTNVGIQPKCLSRGYVQRLKATPLRSRDRCLKKDFRLAQTLKGARFDSC